MTYTILELAEDLEKAKVPKAEIEAFIKFEKAKDNTFYKILATKEDISKLKEDISNLKAATKADISNLKWTICFGFSILGLIMTVATIILALHH